MSSAVRVVFTQLPSVAWCVFALAVGCGFPPEIDTPQLNANAADKLKAFADSGSCVPGVFKANVGAAGDKLFTMECTVHGNVYVDGTPATLQRIRHIKEVIGLVVLSGPTDLAEALPDLEKINGVMATGYQGKALTAPKGLKSLYSVNLEKNGHVESIAGFDAITELQALHIANNQALVSVTGFGQLAALTTLTVDNNPKLAKWSALGKVTQVGKLTFKANPQLLAISPFAVLAKVDGDLTIQTMNIGNLDAFPALQKAVGLKITGLPKCTALAFPQLAAVDTLYLLQAPMLTTLDGLPKLQVGKVVSLCLDSVPCADVAAFAQKHTPSVPQTQWTNCASWVACKN